MSDFVRLFAYDRWANDEVLRSLSALPTPPQRAVNLIAHIIGTQYVWHTRMTCEKNGIPVWPDWDVRQTAAAVSDIAGKFAQLAGAGDDFLRGHFSYTNSKGEKWTSRNDDVMMHVVMHGAYHRGQIAAAIRAGGNEPPYTDYVQATRASLLP